jgi:hypothetical protein
MRSIEAVVTVAAPPASVWSILVAAEQYDDWNPFITSVSGPLTEGSRPTVRVVPPGRRPMTFRPRVVEASPGLRLAWNGSLLVPGVCDGLHEFLLRPTPAGTTVLVQRETFRGVLVPLLGGMLEPTRQGFEAMHEALRQRVEALADR